MFVGAVQCRPLLVGIFMKRDLGISNQDIESAIDSYIPHQRNRQILKRKLVDGITFERVAEEFDLSVRQVKYIVYDNEEFIYRMAKK